MFWWTVAIQALTGIGVIVIAVWFGHQPRRDVATDAEPGMSPAERELRWDQIRRALDDSLSGDPAATVRGLESLNNLITRGAAIQEDRILAKAVAESVLLHPMSIPADVDDAEQRSAATTLLTTLERQARLSARGEPRSAILA
ncbi:hypothetical protein ABIB25_001255 [Nakamurella sp. UYEF19]|uniref:hypothetical protein n=1 Tax=Nakamurella sp. UYEF19 TaxID=1756392 RepID=UPI003392FEE4